MKNKPNIEMSSGNSFIIGEKWASEEHKSCYFENVHLGKDICKSSKIAVVSLARNCEKNLQNSIDQIVKLQSKDFKLFVYENNSTDGTKDILNDNKNKQITISLNTDESAYLKDRSRERTKNLACYRNKCLDWVRQNCPRFDYALVLDLDADAGFSIDGIYNSISWLQKIKNSAGMGSYSLCYRDGKFVHYDIFAIRVNGWRSSPKVITDGELSFINYHPKVGCKPLSFYSCFGGLAVYNMRCFLDGNYDGSLGCEHVWFHKSMRDKGHEMYLNPNSIFFAINNK